MIARPLIRQPEGRVGNGGDGLKWRAEIKGESLERGFWSEGAVACKILVERDDEDCVWEGRAGKDKEVGGERKGKRWRIEGRAEIEWPGRKERQERSKLTRIPRFLSCCIHTSIAMTLDIPRPLHAVGMRSSNAV